MGAAAILQLVLTAVPEAITVYEKIRGTMGQSDLAALDSELAAADVQRGHDHDELAAALATAL
jgi:hypothetical protein